MSAAEAFLLWLACIWTAVIVPAVGYRLWCRRRRQHREIIEHTEAHWR